MRCRAGPDTIRAGKSIERTMGTMKNILLAVDGSEHSLRAANYVARLMRGAPDCVLHLVHVEEAVPMRTHAFLSQAEIDQLYEKEAKQRCTNVKDFLKQQGIAFQWHLRIGEPAAKIVEEAARLGVDAIVIGSRGMGAVGSLVLGSVALKVVHEATVPVTIVK
jgi:nucleotide-binding universal stress UspA family protein